MILVSFTWYSYWKFWFHFLIDGIKMGFLINLTKLYEWNSTNLVFFLFEILIFPWKSLYAIEIQLINKWPDVFNRFWLFKFPLYYFDLWILYRAPKYRNESISDNSIHHINFHLIKYITQWSQSKMSKHLYILFSLNFQIFRLMIF